MPTTTPKMETTLTELKPLFGNGSVPRGANLTKKNIAQYAADLNNHPNCRLALNAVTQTALDDIALDRSIVTSIDHTFSNVLDDWDVTNQKQSGRCWLFAGLNLFRVGAMKKMNIKNFEFSQNYMLFWDKFERANYFLEAIIETADRPVDDRTVGFLLDRPFDDGGQWNMFVSVVKKHGVVPKSAMPETISSSATARMNSMCLLALRQAARDLRQAAQAGQSINDLRKLKQDILCDVYRMLCIHLGTPPKKFNWQWQDKDKKFHRDGKITPQEMAEKYITLPIDDYVCLVHDPRPTSPMNRTYTVQYLGNVVGGQMVKYLNVDIKLMKKIAMDAMVEHEEPVWFGCDVGKMMQRKVGIWDAKLFDYEGVYDKAFTMGKADRLIYHPSLMTHAMLLTGVDVVDGKPNRWRVENSWGDDTGKKGFFTMNDSWFAEYMLEIAAPRDRLPAELQEALDLEPIVLPPWDPMGSLAR